MNVLVVGGAGYVGGAVTDILSKSQHSVRVYDALLYEEFSAVRRKENESG